MKKYKYLIFDLDDTLIDNLENVKHAFKLLLENVNETFTEDKFERWYNIDKQFWLDCQNNKITVPNEYIKTKDLKIDWIRAQRYLIYFNNSILLEEAIKLNEQYMNNLKEMVYPIEGVYEVLNYLSNEYDIIVATNGPSIAVKDKLQKIDCLKFVKFIFSADMFGHMKPFKGFFDGIKEILNFYDNEKFLVIGDSLISDIKGANDSQMDSCWFNWKGEELTKEYNPTIIIENLKELVKKL